MALPVISHNTPSAGRISWTAFGIQYDGDAFNIPADTTDKKFVWWRYNGGTAPALGAGDTLPDDLAADDMVLFLNKSGIGLLVPLAEVLDGSLIVSGSVLADAIGANQVYGYHVGADQISTRELAANSVTVIELAAGAVTTSRLSVGSVGQNMIANGSFEDGTEGYVISQGSGTADVVGGVSSSGASALRLIRNSSNQAVKQAAAFYIPVSGVNGSKWYISCRAGAGSSLASGFYLRVFWYQADKVTAASTASVDIASNQPLSSAWAVFEGQATPPSNARYLAVEVINALGTSTMYVDEITALEVIVAAQIADGAITANKILVNALDGKTITGALIRSAASGQRVEMTSAGLKGYDAAGVVKTSVGTDGLLTAVDAVITGTIKTATLGQRVVINGGTNAIQFYDSTDASDTVGPAQIFGYQGAGAGDGRIEIPTSVGKVTIGKSNLPSGGSSTMQVEGILEADAMQLFGENVGRVQGSVVRVDSSVGVVGSSVYRANGFVFLTIGVQRPVGIVHNSVIAVSSLSPNSGGRAGAGYSTTTGAVGTFSIDSSGNIRFLTQGTPGVAALGSIFWAV